jgi:hypothetical protein
MAIDNQTASFVSHSVCPNSGLHVPKQNADRTAPVGAGILDRVAETRRLAAATSAVFLSVGPLR